MNSISVVKITDLPESTDPHRRAMLDPEFAARLAEQVARLVSDTVCTQVNFLPSGALERAREAVFAFYDLYEQRPVRDNLGGFGFNDSLWLFVLARAIDPAFIVESGVHRGHTTWLLRAACPDAELHCFDVQFGNRVHVDVNAHYHEHDWMETEISAPDGRRSLVFFDDHVSHARRIVEAWRRGFQLAIFDDNFPAYNLYATGRPPVPTLDMILDPDLDRACQIEWTRNGKRYSYRHDPADARTARALIDRYAVMPELALLTRHSTGSGLSLVKLASAGCGN